MRRWGPGMMAATLAASLAIWAALAGVCLLAGSTAFHWPTWEDVRYRGELIVLASIIGAALSSAGVVYQAILRNPLADPYLLGVSSGASLAAYLWRFPFVGSMLAAVVGAGSAAATQQAFAFAGAVAAVAVVFLLATRRGRLEPLTLLLVGVIVNAICGSIFLLINSISRDLTAQSGGAFTFLVGGIQTNLTIQQEISAGVCIAIGWLVLVYLAGQLNVATLSEAEAEALGVRIRRLRWIAMIVASLVTASAVAISGPIGFVGLVCPHLARLLVGSDVRRVLPVATALGAGLLALADAASRYLIGTAQTLLPVGVLTGLLGGPFFLLLLWQSRRATLPEGQR